MGTETDPRYAIYADLHHQMQRDEGRDLIAARKILDIVWEYLRPSSVLDVGCGRGTWLAVAGQCGVSDILGVEGAWLDRGDLLVNADKVSTIDLEVPLSLGRRFDLILCLEVAEHLSAAVSDIFVSSLVAHGDVVLFSAAIPHQGGHHHVNEQFADYWAERFAQHGFVAIDVVRPRIWGDREIPWWLRQNILLYVKEGILSHKPELLRAHTVKRMISVVHPDLYVLRVREMEQALAEYRKLLQLFSTGTTFRVEVADGRFSITKTS
jgi:SAM-dependent methyltransferase